MLKITRLLENPIYHGTEILTISRANTLRKEMTKAEKFLWSKIRRRQINGYKFRKQHAINQFIVDFYCHDKKLIIEVDGEYHNQSNQAEYDIQRTLELEKLGLRVIRFTNHEVINDIDIVITKIQESLIETNPKTNISMHS